MAQNGELSVPMSDLINCLSDTIDLVSPRLSGHHNRVGRVAHALACQMDLPADEQVDLYFAGNLHDIGALSLTDRIRLNSFDGYETNNHAETGALLLEMFQPLAGLADLVRFHHVKWDHGAGELHRGRQVPLGSHILHLADRISVLIGEVDGINLLVRVPEIVSKIENASGTMFSPALAGAFFDLAGLESFWLSLAFPGCNQSYKRPEYCRSIDLDTEGVIGLSRMFARIIDFRSHFTATHSSGVAATAEALARLSGKPESECAQMRIAGLLHDLGKLAVPAELLEKPAGLNSEERALIRCHTYFTRRALENIPSFENITAWSANHHERIDGRGYPFHVGGSDLLEGSRIMAVSDVFTALTEDRPYRAGMGHAAVQKVLYSMSAQSALDPDVVDMAMRSYVELDAVRAAAQAEAVSEYGEVNCRVAGMAAG